MMQTRNSGSRFWALLAMVFLLAVWAGNAPLAQAQTTNKPVDVNSADLPALETLPGVGPATAQKIIEGWPYKSLADLEKVKGLSKSKVDALKGQVVFGPAATTATTAKSSKNAPAPQTQATKNVVDVNSADLATLETLPGIGSATAQKIIEGRPYKSLADLQKVKGLSKAKVDALKDQVIFGPPVTATTAQPSQASKAAGAKAPPATASTTVEQKGAKPAAPTPTGHATGTLAPGQKININTATPEELDSLPGIGPAKAQAIIDYRTQNGPFKTIDDIQKVKGIKEGEFSKIKDSIKVSN